MSGDAGRALAESPLARVAMVSVHYYPRYLTQSVAAVGTLGRAAGAGMHVAVANDPAIAAELARAAGTLGFPRADCIVHDNRGLEFGAFQAGLDRLLRAEDPDWILFVNDTFARHRPFPSVHRRHLLAALTRPSDDRTPLAAGEVEEHGRSWEILGKRSHRWLTTAVFALNRPALHVLGDKVYSPEVDALVRTTAESSAFFAPELDPAIADHIRAWILAPASRHTWYRSAPLSAENASRMAGKARAILQEKYLSAALEEAGTWFFDVKGSGAKDRIQRRMESWLLTLAARVW